MFPPYINNPPSTSQNLKNNFATQDMDYDSKMIPIDNGTIMLIQSVCCVFAGVQVPDAGDS